MVGIFELEESMNIRRNRFWWLKVNNKEGDDGGDPEDTGGGGDSGGDPSGDGDGGGDPPDKGAWPEDWQSRLAGGDEKLLKQFGRYQSPEAVGQALVAAQRKIRSGDLIPKLSEKADEKEIAEYRKQLGIPDKAEGYELKFDSGRVIGEEDKPFVDEFLKVAHQSNMTQAQVKSALDWYYTDRDAQVQARNELDLQQREEALNELEEEWGSKNMGVYKNRIGNLLSKFPEAVRDAIMDARLSDGRALFNHPDILRGLVAIDLELDPAGTVVTGSGDPMKGIDAEIEEIEKFMREKRSEYNKDEKKQARLRELYEVKEKLQQRQKAG